jgi:hypothetical protein
MQQEFRDATVTIETSRPEDAVLGGLSGHFTQAEPNVQPGSYTVTNNRAGVLCIESETIPGYLSAYAVTVKDEGTGETIRYEVLFHNGRPYVKNGCTYFQARVRP